MDNISLSLLTLYEALANSPYTTITGDLDTTATSITIVNPAAIPSTFPCLLTIGYDTSTAETVLATSISGDTLTVTRGVDGTLQTWTAGSRISRVFTAKDLNDIQTNISRIAAAIGSASLDTEAQTLVGAINELDAGKCKLVKGYLSSSTGAFYSDSGFTTLVTDNENSNNLYLDLNSYRLYKYIAVGTGVLDVGYNLITVDDDLDVIRTPKYGVCSTAAGTAAKAVTINGITSLVTGLTIAVKFSNNNTAASPTLQVNSLTAKPIYQHGTTPAGTDDATTGWYAGAVVILAYDGTGWVMSKGVNNALDAGDVVYDNQETYASGTVGKEVSDLNGAINAITPLDTSPTSGSTKGITSGSVYTAINNLKENVASKVWNPTATATLLSYIIDNCDRNTLPFSFVKIGSATVSDVPTEFATLEFNGIIYGSGDRIIVQIQQFASVVKKFYQRSIFQNNWRTTGWSEFITTAVEDISSTITISATTGTISQKSAYKFGHIVMLSFVFTTNQQIPADTSIEFVPTFSDNSSSPALRSQTGGSNRSSIYGFVSKNSNNNFNVMSETILPSGTAFWVSFMYFSN